MLELFQYLCRHSSKLALLSFFVLGVTNVSPIVAQPPVTFEAKAETQENKPVEERILGEWQTKDSQTEETLILIFAPEGKLFLVFEEREKTVALEAGYEINGEAEPKELDIFFSDKDKSLTVFAFQGEDQLLIENTSPGDPRPEKLGEEYLVFTKISDRTELADNVELIAPEEFDSATQPSIPIQYINILGLAQQSYFQEKGKFATNLEEMGIVATLESQLYRYAIDSPTNEEKKVFITAIPKEAELPSYTGAILVTGEDDMVTGICRTDESSFLPPVINLDNLDAEGEIMCPIGSSLIQGK